MTKNIYKIIVFIEQEISRFKKGKIFIFFTVEKIVINIIPYDLIPKSDVGVTGLILCITVNIISVS